MALTDVVCINNKILVQHEKGYSLLSSMENLLVFWLETKVIDTLIILCIQAAEM